MTSTRRRLLNPNDNVLPSTPIAYIILTERTRNCLYRNDILYICELARWTEEDIMAIRMFGKKCLDEIKAFMKTAGVSFRTS